MCVYFFRYMYTLSFVQYIVPLVIIGFAYIRIAVVSESGNKGCDVLNTLSHSFPYLLITWCIFWLVPRNDTLLTSRH